MDNIHAGREGGREGRWCRIRRPWVKSRPCEFVCIEQRQRKRVFLETYKWVKIGQIWPISTEYYVEKQKADVYEMLKCFILPAHDLGDHLPEVPLGGNVSKHFWSSCPVFLLC